jgi:hypothetical protein
VQEGGLAGCLAHELAVAGCELELGELLLGGLAAGVGGLGQEFVGGVEWHLAGLLGVGVVGAQA